MRRGCAIVLQEGAVLMISGTAFSSKTQAAPLIFDDFESGSLGAAVENQPATVGAWGSGDRSGGAPTTARAPAKARAWRGTTSHPRATTPRCISTRRPPGPSTLARIVVGNAPTFAASTLRIIQIPETWSATNASAHARTTGLGVGQTGYLFVVDTDDVPSSGYPMVVGGGSGLAPAPPIGLSAR